MDYNALAKDCEFRSEIYRMQHDSERLVHEKQCAKSILDLVERAEKSEKIVDEYSESARAIALWLSAYCDKTLSYPSMISNAVRKISIAYADMEKRAEKAEKERDDYKELFFAYKHVCGGVSPDRIGELVEADNVGKVAILPVKPGDTIYQIGHKEIIPFRVGNVAVEEWGLSFEGHLEGFGVHRTMPGEKVFFTIEEANEVLERILSKEKQDGQKEPSQD